MDEQPHKAIRLLAVVVAASVVGATLGLLTAQSISLGRLLVTIGVILIVTVGAYGIVKGEPILGALGGLGLLMLVEPIPELALFLLGGSLGLITVSIIATAEQFIRRRREEGTDSSQAGD